MAERQDELADQLVELAGIPLSSLSHHGEPCCHIARHAVLSRLVVGGSLEAELALVPSVIEWGPVHWPVAWCELVDDRRGGFRGDCGVHASLAATLISEQGLLVRRARIALLPPPVALEHWRQRWSDPGLDRRWVAEAVAHHEVVGVLGRWWDPSEARWFSGPGATLAAGRVFALRETGSDWSFRPGE